MTYAYLNKFSDTFEIFGGVHICCYYILITYVHSHTIIFGHGLKLKKDAKSLLLI